MSRRARAFCFTINNYDEKDTEILKDIVDNVRYIVYGFEVGEQGTPHIQGYVCFKTLKGVKQVSRMLPRAHIEIAKGNSEQNRTYCTKDGEYIEHGDMPLTPKKRGDNEKERWTAAKEAALNGNLEDVPDDIYIRYYRTLKEIRKDHIVTPEDSDDVTGLWYHGVAGVGKSRKARTEFPDAYKKMCNKWWDGYQEEEYVIIDDVDPNHKVLGHHFKIWADRYAFLAETKGGALMIRPKKIIITSQYSPEEIWDDQQTVDAIRRRFKVINIH